tara:strand:+ start:19 stop:1059 length:1041 start_codon:yes stop_codon:yes gene_type:complete
MGLGKSKILSQGASSTDFFTPLTYTGNGGTQSISSLTFAPSLVWIKDRDVGECHTLTDIIRGAPSSLSTSSTAGEYVDSTYKIRSLDSNGFTVKDVSQGFYGVNGNNVNYIAYCFNGGDTTVTDEGTRRANPDAGFSIVETTTGSSTNPAVQTQFGEYRYKHGLNSEPKLILAKSKGLTRDWECFFKISSSSVFDFAINSTRAPHTYTIPTNFTSWDSTRIHAWNYPSANTSPGDPMIIYNFADVAGVQKIGSYTGTGSAGQSITTGFEPRFLIIKSTVGADNWRLYDTVRGITSGGFLEPNNCDSENTSSAPNITMTATGFEITSGGVTQGNNSSGNLYIYLAIA